VAPFVESFCLFARKAQVLGSHTLENVVVVLGDSEDGWLRLGNVPERSVGQRPTIWKDMALYLPSGLDVYCAQKPNQSVPHQSNTTTLWGTVEEGNFDIIVFERFDVFHGSLPCLVANRALEVFLAGNLSMTLAVDQDLIFPANAHTGLVFSSEVTIRL
jgi:hypothetical protein